MQTTSKDFRRLTAWPLLLVISLFAAAPIAGFAQLMQADDYFHEGAQDYIFGEKDKAVKAIGSGLQAYPQDPKLNGVARLLMKKEDEQKQNQSKNQNQKQDQKKQDKQDQQKNSQNQNQQQQQQQQQQAQNDQQKKDDQKKQDQAKQDQQKKEQEAQANKSDERNQSGETNQAGMVMAQMTPQEARQLLDAQRDDEKALPFQPTNMPSPPPNVAMRDW